MIKNNTNTPITLKSIVSQFILHRINSSIEKKLARNIAYKELEQKFAEFEKKISGFLTDEQKDVFREYNDLMVELLCYREEFIYRRGIIDAFRLKDIFIGTIE